MTRVLILLCLAAVNSAHQFFIHNRCHQTVWVGLLGNSLLDEGGYELLAGQSRTTDVPNHWSGRVWGRTGCGDESRCETGDCGGGKIQCRGAGGKPPATLAEITFDTGRRNVKDFYDISLVDGYNLPMTFTPKTGFRSGTGQYYCAKAGCTSDLNRTCPCELAVHGTAGVVACKSACAAFKRDDYCCRGAHDKPDTCPPTDYSKIFKLACPDAYSYAYDDRSSTFTCDSETTGSSTYDITFC